MLPVDWWGLAEKKGVGQFENYLVNLKHYLLYCWFALEDY